MLELLFKVFKVSESDYMCASHCLNKTLSNLKKYELFFFLQKHLNILTRR